MGWTSYHAEHYKNGKIDRQAECIAYFEAGLNRGHFKVIKSSMQGSAFYGAVKILTAAVKQADGQVTYRELPEEEQTVFGVVIITAVNSKDYFNFSYKVIDESMGPAYDNCPVSIISLLSPTEQEYALNWRKRCLESGERKKRREKLKKLPLGTNICFPSPYNTVFFKEGDEVVLIKAMSCGKTKWMVANTNYYWSQKYIPDDYKVVYYEVCRTEY